MLLHSDLPAAYEARRLIGAQSIDDARAIISKARRQVQSVNNDITVDDATIAPPQELMSFESTSALEYAGYSVQV